MEKARSKKHWLYKNLKKILSSPEMIKNRVKEAGKSQAEFKDKKKIFKDKITDYLIREKLKPITTLGVLTGAVGLVPGLGQIGAVVTTIAVELVTVTQQEIELCLEIAHNYGHDITDEKKRVLEILAIIGQKREVQEIRAMTKIATRKAIEKVIERYSRVGMLRALRRTARKAELKLGLRAFTKLIPILGMTIGGLANYRIIRNTGSLAKQYYRTYAGS